MVSTCIRFYVFLFVHFVCVVIETDIFALREEGWGGRLDFTILKDCQIVTNVADNGFVCLKSILHLKDFLLELIFPDEITF